MFSGIGAFVSVELDSTKAMKLKAKALREEDTGVLLVDVKTDYKNYVVQLIDKDYKIVKSVRNTTKIVFDNLAPASYMLRIIADANDNGKWDPGNFINRQDPEDVRYYINQKKEKNILIKANWEVGPLLITY